MDAKKEIDYSRLLGEFIGTLEGVLHWDIPEQLKTKLQKKIDELNKITVAFDFKNGWNEYDWNKPETRPTAYGKYFVCRKDGKVHWETWNGSSWAYNEKVITHWMDIKAPVTDEVIEQLKN